jgi:galactoside O-acetyltransferase
MFWKKRTSGGYYNSKQLKRMGFSSVGENSIVSKRVEIQDTSRISIGNNVRIDAFTTITTGENGFLNIGSNIHIADRVRLLAAGGIILKDFSALATGSCVLSSSDDYSGMNLIGPMTPKGSTRGTYGLVTFEKYSVVGTHTVVFPNVTLGEGCAVGACSLVNHSLSPWGVYFGIPAKFLKPRKRDMLKFLPRHSSEVEFDG